MILHGWRTVAIISFPLSTTAFPIFKVPETDLINQICLIQFGICESKRPEKIWASVHIVCFHIHLVIQGTPGKFQLFSTNRNNTALYLILNLAAVWRRQECTKIAVRQWGNGSVDRCSCFSWSRSLQTTILKHNKSAHLLEISRCLDRSVRSVKPVMFRGGLYLPTVYPFGTANFYALLPLSGRVMDFITSTKAAQAQQQMFKDHGFLPAHCSRVSVWSETIAVDEFFF